MALCTNSYSFYGCTNGGTSTTCTKTGLISVQVANTIEPLNCTGQVMLNGTEYREWLTNQQNFGWDTSAFELAAAGSFLMFVTGYGVGLAINQIRRMRTP